MFLDWDRILQCGNNNEIKECGELYTYISPKIPNFLTSIILVYSIIFTIVKFCIFIIKYKDLVNTYNYYTNSLHISCEELQTSTWTKIVNKIIEVNAKNITICDITNKILRTDNYFIALIHKDIIKLPSISLYTSQLDFNLRHIILNDIVNIDHGTLKRRFILYGLLNLLFSVIIFIYLSMHFFASNIDEFYSNKDILGSRKYTIYAKWKFREYNELKHFFEKRLTKSMPVGVSYIKNFPAPTTEVICKNIGIICGAFIGFFVILSLLDESILLYVRLFDRTLLFYAGIIGAISSIARGTIRKPENTIYNPAAIMEKIYKYTHYMPDRWKKKTNTYAVKDDFLKLFPYSFILFLYELLSVFTTPYILLFILPKQSIDITYFIKNHTVKSQNVGPICRFANFETPDQNNDRKMDQSLSYFTEMNSIEYESSLQVTNIA